MTDEVTVVIGETLLGETLRAFASMEELATYVAELEARGDALARELGLAADWLEGLRPYTNERRVVDEARGAARSWTHWRADRSA